MAMGQLFMPVAPRSSSIAPRPPITATISARARPCSGSRCGRLVSSRRTRFSRSPPILPRAKPGPKRAAISSMWCRCRRPCARRSMSSSPSIMSSNRSTNASATAPIRRRKRKAAEDVEATRSSGAVDAAPEGAHPNEDQREGGDAPRARGGASDRPESAPDLTKLPPIETITAESDIRAFLAPGVPPELTRAALRRAWAADPKIRDFVGLADYDWDFNAPAAMTGFGSLEMTDELRQQIARMVGGNLANEATGSSAQTSAEVQGKPAPAETSTESVATAAEMSTQQVHSDAGTSQNERIGAQNEPHNSEALPQRSKVDIASRNSSENTNNDQLIERRPHGRALPK